MKRQTKVFARSAILAAMATALVYVAAVLPTMELAFVAIAGLTGAAAVIHCGAGSAAAVFAVSAVLGLLLAPDKGGALLYAAFLGYYPALKSLIERIRSRALCWAVKLALFNIVAVCLWLFASALLLGEAVLPLPLWLLWLGLNAVFVIYDVGLSRLIYVYIRQFAGKIGK